MWFSISVYYDSSKNYHSATVYCYPDDLVQLVTVLKLFGMGSENKFVPLHVVTNAPINVCPTTPKSGYNGAKRGFDKLIAPIVGADPVIQFP